MLVSDFDYILPPELIAQQPVEPRDSSRLLVFDRKADKLSDRFFYELDTLLNRDDLLVFNDTKVIPARLFAEREGSQGGKIEIFLLKQTGVSQWECLARPGKRVKPGMKLRFFKDVQAEVVGITEGGERILKFPADLDFRSWLLEVGETPLPPYIHQKLADSDRYQTIYAEKEGSVAAPTAGLHFTKELLERLKKKGVKTGFLTLHVGIGTFRPVKTEEIEEHIMHPEFFVLADELVQLIEQTKKAGNRVIAVGTTVVRVLESQAAKAGRLKSGSGETAIFIYPGFKFQVIDAMITNFHLPKSTLLMLVSAFTGRDNMLRCYRHAVEERYRFFSFGDAMFIK